jgi:hypothetical protein
MFRASTAHHQEERCKYVASGITKMTLSEPGWNESHLRSTFCHIHMYILPPDDGLLMPGTYRGILIQQTKNKQCINLVFVYILYLVSLVPVLLLL